MNMTLEDSRLLAELCEQHGVSADKILKLLVPCASANSRTGAAAFMTRCARF